MCSERLSNLPKVLQLRITPPEPDAAIGPACSGLFLTPGGLAGVRNLGKRPWKQKAHPSLGRMCSVTGQTSDWEALATARKTLGGSGQGPVRQDGTGGAGSHVLPTCRGAANVGRAGTRVDAGPGVSCCPVTNCLTMGLASLGLSFPRCTMTGLN